MKGILWAHMGKDNLPDEVVWRILNSDVYNAGIAVIVP